MVIKIIFIRKEKEKLHHGFTLNNRRRNTIFDSDDI
jgi:hypothetical protein